MAEDELYFPDSRNKGNNYDKEETLQLPLSVDKDVFRLAGKVIQHTYDESEWTLDARNARHPFPYELNMILAAGLEGKLVGDAAYVFQNMQENSGEWYGVVFQNAHPDLIIHYAPRTITWDDTNKDYDGTQMTSAYKKQYSLHYLPEGGTVALRILSELCPALVEELWNLPFHKLPLLLQQNARIWIPPRGQSWPMARAGFKQHGILGGPNYSLMATRGVHEIV